MAADQIWFIPVTGGGPFSVTATGSGPLIRPSDLNVQYAFKQYPTQQAHISPAAPIFAVETHTEFDQAEGASSIEPGKLLNCFARFIWDSCACDETYDTEITLGGQLNVGTVFAAYLPPGTADLAWKSVQIWVKMRISAIARLSGVYLTVSDRDGTNKDSSGNLRSSFTDGEWFVINWTVDDVTSWEVENLRSTVSVLGTDNVANIGRVSVDMEWFAFRLFGDPA